MQESRVSESGYLKTSLMAIAPAVERMVLLVAPNFEKDQTNDAENLIIHDRLIPNPFSLKTVNNLITRRRRLGCLIYHRCTDYD